ncbi:MAG: exonuclease domain-containing protein, partial [Turicibacter sp.]
LEHIKRCFRPGEFTQFSYNPNSFKMGSTTYYVITSIKDEKHKDEDLVKINSDNELKYYLEFLSQSKYYAFIDLEFSMSGPEFRGMKFCPEIIQFGIIIADSTGKMVEKFSAYVKPTKFTQLSGLTKDFLKITDSTLSYGINYKDFYDYIKEVIARYQPVFLVWGVSDGYILENSYLLNKVPPLFEATQLIDLQRIHRQYYKIPQDIGLYNAIRSYGLDEGTQIHDAIVDALVLRNIFFSFKSILADDEYFPFKENYLAIMNNR